MASAEQNYSVPALNPECVDNGDYSAPLHAAQDKIN